MAAIVVFIEVRRGAATAPSRFAVAEARRVATELGATVYALVTTVDASEEAVAGHGRTLGEAGADRILCCADAALDGPLLDATVGPLLAAVGARLRPVLTLFPAGTVAAALAPPFAVRLGALYQARAALTIDRAAGHPRVLVQRLRPDGALRTVSVGETGHPVVATLSAGETTAAHGEPSLEVETLAPSALGPAVARELGADPDEGEQAELASAVLALGPGLDPAEREAQRAALPGGVAFVDDGAAAAMEAACPARLLVVSRGPTPAAVRGAISPGTFVAVAGAKAAEKDLTRIDLVWRPAARRRLGTLAAALRPEEGAPEEPE
jgi:electron transfer flavoprotein alpha subunit